jgi:hypothetical protein
MLYWIQHNYCIYLLFGFRDIEPKLLAIDAFQVYNISEVIAAFKNLKTTVLLIPCRYTGIVQVLDIVLNQLLKILIRQEADNHYNSYIEQ